LQKAMGGKATRFVRVVPGAISPTILAWAGGITGDVHDLL
jgi:hypothetical protein